MPLPPSKRKLIVLCDGTWCGSESNTQSNIFRLAEMIGIDMTQQNPTHAQPIRYDDNARGINACYFPGAGLGGTFLEYLFNGLTCSDIDRDCIDVYKYIVQHYSIDHEIWMFGFSRGAYTMRCVAGMINNCGILKQTNNAGPLDLCLCDQVYRIYRSRAPEDHPKAARILKFKEHASYDVRTPVKFMGVMDTVGSLGVPTLDAGIGVKFPGFYDQKVSSAVEKVYHALSIHDRLLGLEPCRTVRDPKHKGRPELEIREHWFPGCHYDIGRHRWRFLRNGSNWIESVVGRILSPLSNVIEPNRVLADLVLKWMLESIRNHDPQGMVIQGIDARIDQLIADMKGATRADTGSGDIYNNVLAFGPAGKVWQALASTFPGQFSDLKIVIGVLLQARDRMISDSNAVLTLYNKNSAALDNFTIANRGWIVEERYPSQTYENFMMQLAIMGEGVSAGSVPF
ncbi:hypothetical protein K457DRAFT_26276 [Linnemannia elongata AG-77]|uniref:T6SS Phospholipase effector Tle1-like catalytic domain-containing protein n=1 Tax=Linnemannia elongata AG-77 TaxID=1314771 RepID=A0A197JCN2_9FUNG|nr:hypothetical protein K457DRAFT_26276 [Linnemannia elongata AG-77]